MEGAIYVFRNRAATALTLLCYDGQGFWLLMKRLSPGHCTWWPTTLDARVPLSAREVLIVLWHGNPDGAQMAQDWRRVASGAARRRAYAHGSHAAGSAQTSPRCSCSATRYSTALIPAETHVAIRLVSTLAL